MKQLDVVFDNAKQKKLQNRIFNTLKHATPRNVFISAFHKVAHSTDATDWRANTRWLWYIGFGI